jgi:hypothetical protein
MHIAKLFKSTFGPFSNLWLEGQRLVENGFLVGVEYRQLWYKDQLVLTTDLAAKHEGVVAIVQKRVLGSSNPLIRIEGKRVVDTFTACQSVRVEYGAGTVTITANRVATQPRAVEVLPDPAGVALALAGR